MSSRTSKQPSCRPGPRLSDASRERKESVLEMLSDTRDWVSGEKISNKLGISRAAVSKHVAALRREGQIIDSAPRRGFLLRVQDLPPTADNVLVLLRKYGLPEMVLGKRIWRCLEETTSTSSEAVAWAVEGAPEGSVVTAERQTRGRGRKGHDWFSAPRGLQFSVILRPAAGSAQAAGEPVAVQTVITRMGALAVMEAVLNLTGMPALFKEPNDLLLDGRKLAGVLVENGFRGGEPDWIVLGIGCNVNALPEEFPAELREKTCSILSAWGQELSRDILLAEILKRLDSWYRALASEDKDTSNSTLERLNRAWARGSGR